MNIFLLSEVSRIFANKVRECPFSLRNGLITKLKKITPHYFIFLPYILSIDGYYALCDGSLLLKESDICEIKKSVNLRIGVHFQFYYYMYGRQIGTLLLALNNTVIWSLSDSQEEDWLLTEIFIPKGFYEVKNI